MKGRFIYLVLNNASVVSSSERNVKTSDFPTRMRQNDSLSTVEKYV